MTSARLAHSQTAQHNAQSSEPITPADLHRGSVKSFGKVVEGKKTSYGWITDDRTGKDVFVHFTGIVSQGDKFRHLQSGQRVQFRIVTENGRQKAVDVEVFEGNSR